MAYKTSRKEPLYYSKGWFQAREQYRKEPQLSTTGGRFQLGKTGPSNTAIYKTAKK
jgi:hypothetical protein